MSNESKRPKRASVQAVADLAGVSKTTVSHILNRKQPYFEQFSQETIERVLKCATDLNYRPNILASGLKTGKSRLFAVSFEDCWSDADTRAWSGGTESLLLSAVSACAGRRNYFPVVGIYGVRSSDVEIQTLDNLVQAGVGGVLVKAPTEETSRYLKELQKKDFPFMVIFPQGEPVGANYIDVDNREGGKIATRRLIELGHTRILCITGWEERISEKHRYEGYVEAMRAAGLEPLESIILKTEISHFMPEEYVTRLRRTLASTGATAAFVTHGGVSMSMVADMEHIGVRVPGNLAIVGTDVGGWTRHGVPRITSIGIDWYQTGEIATGKLLDQMETDEPMKTPASLSWDFGRGETDVSVSEVHPIKG